MPVWTTWSVRCNRPCLAPSEAPSQCARGRAPRTETRSARRREHARLIGGLDVDRLLVGAQKDSHRMVACLACRRRCSLTSGTG